MEVDITRSLGLDIGDRRIGVALSDPEGKLASPFTIINCKDNTADLAAITDIIHREQVKEVIVGLPRLMDGRLGKQAEKVKLFTQKLRSQNEVPVEFRDERLTTVSVKRLMLSTKPSRNRRKTRYDAMAAALILQGYLDEKQ